MELGGNLNLCHNHNYSKRITEKTWKYTSISKCHIFNAISKVIAIKKECRKKVEVDNIRGK